MNRGLEICVEAADPDLICHRRTASNGVCIRMAAPSTCSGFEGHKYDLNRPHISSPGPLLAEPTDVALSGGTIVAIGADARNSVRDPRVIDAEVNLPGLADIHTHSSRQPGGEDAGTVFTGTRAAAVGGPFKQW